MRWVTPGSGAWVAGDDQLELPAGLQNSVALVHEEDHAVVRLQLDVFEDGFRRIPGGACDRPKALLQSIAAPQMLSDVLGVDLVHRGGFPGPLMPEIRDHIRRRSDIHRYEPFLPIVRGPEVELYHCASSLGLAPKCTKVRTH